MPMKLNFQVYPGASYLSFWSHLIEAKKMGLEHLSVGSEAYHQLYDTCQVNLQELFDPEKQFHIAIVDHIWPIIEQLDALDAVLPFVDKDTGSVPGVKSNAGVIDMTGVLPHYSLKQVARADLAFTSVNQSLGIPLNGYLVFIPVTSTLSVVHEYPVNPILLYLLERQIQELLFLGTGQIQRDTTYKAALINQLVNGTNGLDFVESNKANRCDTLLVFRADSAMMDLKKNLEKKHILIDMTENGKVALANYPVHSREQYEMLTDAIEAAVK